MSGQFVSEMRIYLGSYAEGVERNVVPNSSNQTRRGLAPGHGSVHSCPMKLSAPKVGSNFKCPHCDVQYRVRISHAPTRDSGTAYCVGCRRKMSEWNDYEQPVFTPMAKGLQSEK